MIEVKEYREQVLDLLVKIMLRTYHDDMFDESKGGWIYRDRLKISMFEAVIYHGAEEEGLKDITKEEVMWIKNKVKEKASV